jgi:crossover junction endodeoxyribonuclease RuvC
MGIDPGSRSLGIAIVETESSVLKTTTKVIFCETLHARSELYSDRLVELGKSLEEIALQFRPQMVSVEKIFLGKNIQSAFQLGQMRGVCLFLLGKQNVKIFEYATRSVKLGLTGHGSSTKEVVRMMLAQQFNRRLKTADFDVELKGLDATDALALATHHLNQFEIETKIRKQNKNEVSL